MACNPCPCMTLQKGCMVLAVIDAVLGMLNLGLFILAIVVIADNKNGEYTESEKGVGIGVAVVFIILCILKILLAFRLYYGARNRDNRQCRIWLIITIIIFTLVVISFIVSNSASDFNGSSFAGNLIDILYKVYEMIVVYTFLQELKLGFNPGQHMTGVVVAPYPPNGSAYPQQQGQQYPYPSGSPVFVTQTPAYPMQQLNTTTTNQAYPAPVHHVSTT